MYKEAIIVAGGKEGHLKELVGQNSDTRIVIGVDAGALALLELGLSVDVAIGDFDSISHKDLQVLKEKVATVIELPAEKDETDTEAALLYVLEEIEVDRIVMFGLFGGRVDHMMSNIWMAYQPRFHRLISKITIKDRNNSLSFYHPGKYELKKESNKKYLSFVGLTAIKCLKMDAVKYPLTGKDYPYPIALVSNEFSKEKMIFSFEEGLMAVVQSKDN